MHATCHFWFAYDFHQGTDVDILFGLDMLRRYRAKIDLELNALVIQGVNVPFLGEADLPAQARMQEELQQPPAASSLSGVPSANNPFPSNNPSSSRQQQLPEAPLFTGSGQRLGGTNTSTGNNPTTDIDSAGISSFPDAHIQQLVELGCSRADAIHALEAAQGDVEVSPSGCPFQQMLS